MSKEQYKVDAKLVSIATGTLASGGVQEIDYSPDESYNEIVGIEAHEVNDGGVADGYYQLGVADDDKVYAELAHKNVLLTNADVPQGDKMRRVNIPIRRDRKIKCRVKWPAGALASDLKVEFVFTLRRTVAATI